MNCVVKGRSSLLFHTAYHLTDYYAETSKFLQFADSVEENKKKANPQAILLIVP